MALLGNQITVSGTAQQLTSGAQAVETLLVKAHASNAAVVYVGPLGATTANGYPVSPGEELVFSPAYDNLKRTPKPSEVYVVGTASDKISWLSTLR